MTTDDVVMADTDSVSPATYTLIQDWIGQQQQTNAPLTAKLRNALLNLEAAVQAEAAPTIEPSIGTANWVGLLLEYQAAHPGVAGGAVFNESSVDPSGRGANLRWSCTVSISERPGESFPHGAAAGGEDGARRQPITFARKKDAKQYAAKCAIEWLRDAGRMPRDGGVKFSKVVRSGPAAAKLKQADWMTSSSAPPQQKKLKIDPSPSAPSVTSPSAPSPSSENQVLSASPFDETQPSSTHEVAALLKSMGIAPPNYDIKQSGGSGGFWSGRADFGVNAYKLPFDAGLLVTVENALGRKAAKEVIAEDLLGHLRAEKAKREADYRAYLQGRNPLSPPPLVTESKDDGNQHARSG